MSAEQTYGTARLPVAPLGSSRPRLATWLSPQERTRLDALAVGVLAVSHCSTVRQVRESVGMGHVDAAVFSTALIGPTDVHEIRATVSGFPEVDYVGLVLEANNAEALTGAVRLGNAGVRTVVDGREPNGMAVLRETLCRERTADQFQRMAVASALSAGGSGGSGDCSSSGWVAFIRAVFSPDMRSAKQVATELGIIPSTLVSRFGRAGLPSPKTYLTLARLAWVAHLAEAPGRSIREIAYWVGASSHQSLSRTICTVTGLTPTQFRQQMTGTAVIEEFCAKLIRPFAKGLCVFDPVRPVNAPSSRGSRAAR